jgi:N utilization substance protein B
MTRRSRGREVALQILFQDDLNPGHSPARADAFLHGRLRNDPGLVSFCRELLAGVRQNRSQIDATLESVAANWSLSRMSATDRNILRLGAFELLHSETPPRVVINEAVELAKRYGTAQSSQFVNGILDRLIRE